MPAVPDNQRSRDDNGDTDLERPRVRLPEPGTPEFAGEAHRQSLLAANSPQAEEDQAFVDSISDMFSDDGLAD